MESATHELPQLTKSSALERNDESSLAFQLLQSAVYSGVESPLRAIAQATDCVGGHADAAIQDGFKQFGVETPTHADFGTGKWAVQQIGGAAGMMLPFLLLRAGIKSGASQLAEQMLGKTLEAGSQTLAQSALREAALSGAAGFVYGAVFSPSNDANVGKLDFLADRLKNGTADMATFAALSAVNPFVAKGFDAAAGAVENSAMPELAKTSVSMALRSPLLSGLMSGVPSGVVSAEATALKDGRLVASADEFKQGIAGMAIVGGTFNTATWALDRVTTPAAQKLESQNVEERAYDLSADDAQSRTSLVADHAIRAAQTGDLANAENDSVQFLVRDHAEESDGRVIVRGQRAQAQEAVPAGDGKIQIIPAGAPQRDAMLENLVMQAMKRVDQPPRAESQIGPETLFIDKMAQAAARRTSFLGASAKSSSADETAASDVPKPANTALASDSHLPGLEVVLGASGAETIAHVGFLKALEDNDVPIGRITGASGGSLVATFFANGYKADQIKDILESNQFKYPRIDVLAKCFHVMDPWNLFPYAMDFKPWLQDLVDTYHLKPQPNLRLVAADMITHEPITFEGTNYDLVTGLAASTAATPGLGLKPVEVNGREAIDGFYYHPTPVALTKAPAIASKIGFVKELPSEPLAPWDYFMHLREMAYYNDFKNRFPDPPGHIIVTTGLPDVATTTFNIDQATTDKLIQHGYDATNARLHEPDAVKAIEEARKNSQK